MPCDTILHKKNPEDSGALDLNTYYLYMKTKRLIKKVLLLVTILDQIYSSKRLLSN